MLRSSCSLSSCEMTTEERMSSKSKELTVVLHSDLPSTSLSTRADPRSMMLQPLTVKSDDKLSECAQCPTCLGNPASMLPFLAAQASSVFSMASGSQGTVHGSVLTTSSQGLTCSGNDTKQSAFGLSEGMDLGNGWKVVGLTSLPGLALPTSTSVHFPQNSAVNSACSESGGQDVSSLINTLPEAANLNKSGSHMNDLPTLSSPIPEEWKVVGLTSLTPGNSNTCNSKSAAVPAQNVTLPDTAHLGCGVSVGLDHTGAEQTELSEQPVVANNLASSPKVPTLADVAAGTCEWKIAGITTLVPPVDASVTCGSKEEQTSPTDTARQAAVPVSALAPDMTLHDSAEWKVVGVTSLNSPPLTPAPIMASSNAPIPLVMASAPPLATVPISPPAAKDMVWKVVGVVPLQQHSETLPKNTDSPTQSQQQTCGISESPVQVQGNGQSSNVEVQIPSSTKSHDKEGEQKSWKSSRLTESRKWASRCLDRHEDPSHPLGFLKNCSNRFRNAVLKRNTVSTMLELKRAYKDVDKKEKLLSFMEGMNHLSLSKNLMYFALKRMSNATSLKSKSVEFEGYTPSLHEEVIENENGLNFDGVEQDCVTENSKYCTSNPKSTEEMLLVNHSTPSSFTEDKLALSMAYRFQMKSEEHNMLEDMHDDFPAATLHTRCLGEKSEENDVSVKKRNTFSDISLKIVKHEDSQSMLSVSDFDSDDVNLTNVDPWGVCTNEDLGEITEMMTDKGGNKMYQSSSRKRKLTTPRKMIQ